MVSVVIIIKHNFTNSFYSTRSFVTRLPSLQFVCFININQPNHFFLYYNLYEYDCNWLCLTKKNYFVFLQKSDISIELGQSKTIRSILPWIE